MSQRKTAKKTFLKISVFYEFRGGVEKGKRGPNEPKVIFLLIKNILFGIFAPVAVPRSSALCLF